MLLLLTKAKQQGGRRVEVFRLAGIYGAGRSVIDALRAGTARRIVKPGQVFNRIHVDDIARVLAAAIDRDTGATVFNVSDDEPAPPEDVVLLRRAGWRNPATFAVHRRALGTFLTRGAAARVGDEEFFAIRDRLNRHIRFV